jgi:hypothetical protein
MSAADLEHIRSFNSKADVFALKGHFARAIENYGAALAAALALGNADCLIVAERQLVLADTWLLHADAPGVLQADANAALYKAFQLVCTAVTTLQRRKAAGTLLPGTCRPLEEAWHVLSELRLGADELARSQRSWLGPFVGYAAYLSAAYNVLNILTHCVTFFLSERAPAFVEFSVTAVDLMLQPRVHSELFINAELSFVNLLRMVGSVERIVGVVEIADPIIAARK